MADTQERNDLPREPNEVFSTTEMLDFLMTLLIEKNVIPITSEEYAARSATYYNQLTKLRTARKDSLEAALKATKEKLEHNIRSIVLAIIIVMIVAGVVSFGLLMIFTPTLKPATMPLHSGTILTFLGFVVALAAYLATVGRALKEKIGKLKEQPEAATGEIMRQAMNLTRIFRAEAMLVFLGLLTVGRVVVGPLANVEVSSFDYFLAVYMCTVIVYLAYLHAAQWSYSWRG